MSKKFCHIAYEKASQEETISINKKITFFVTVSALKFIQLLHIPRVFQSAKLLPFFLLRSTINSKTKLKGAIEERKGENNAKTSFGKKQLLGEL